MSDPTSGGMAAAIATDGLAEVEAVPAPEGPTAVIETPALADDWPQTRAAIAHVNDTLAPALDACGKQEITQLLRGLQGKFVPAGPSGSPSRGRTDVLPTGRNFYTLDSESESIVQQAMNELMQNRTTVVVAHRLSTVRDADQIAVIAEGHLAELGTHDELVELGGIYAGLVDRQSLESTVGG